MPISVEITYGVERILMLLQGVDHFKKIQYADGITYGELFSENEKEMSAYYLEHASVDHIQKHFDFFEAEAHSLLALGLPIPAYDQLLKTSHAFNILDSRGFVGVTERACYFGRMRSLARQCAQLWLKTRESLGHPLGIISQSGNSTIAREVLEEAVAKVPAEPRTFVLEIGTEELRHSLQLAAAVQPIKVDFSTIDDVHHFVNRRPEQYLMDKEISPEVVRSILVERANWPCLAAKSAYKMETLSRGEYLSKVVEAYSRPKRIVRGKDINANLEVDEIAFETSEERALWSTYLSLRNKINPGMEVDDFVEISAKLLQPLEDFFNNVFVIVEDERIRKNRLSLLQKIADLPKGIADLSVLPGF